MGIVQKVDLVCPICQKILNEPVQLPCFCTICNAHLTDQTVSKEGFIKCVTCKEDFDVANSRCKENKLAKILLEGDGHLTEPEKAAKLNILNTFERIMAMQNQLRNTNDQGLIELNCFEHFGEIKRKLDIQREVLKAQVDDLSQCETRKTERNDKFFRQKLAELREMRDFNMSNQRHILDDEFRNVNLDITHVVRLKEESQSILALLKTKMAELNQLTNQIRACRFEANSKPVVKSTYGQMKFREYKVYLLSTSDDMTIKVWDLDTHESKQIYDIYRNTLY